MFQVNSFVKMNSTLQEVFFLLIRAGLWERPAQPSQREDIDFNALYQLANNQSVVGVIAAGLEQVTDWKVKKDQALQFLKRVYSIECQNAEMNRFIASLFIELQKAGIHALLVKGQGIAQCYERPLWRSAGDVDLLLDSDNYKKAKSFLIPRASSVEKEHKYHMHLGMRIDSWTVELHGTMRSYRLGRVNACIDDIHKDTFQNGRFRVWMNDGVAVGLPAADNDVMFVFIHILHHFFSEGIGLRQICDWCRLLWTYHDEIDLDLLAERLERMRLWSEWNVLSSLGVNYLGMPRETMPFYRESVIIKWKADLMMRHIIRTGNFGHNRDSSYLRTSSYFVRKFISFGRGMLDTFHRLLIFPIDSVAFFSRNTLSSIRALARGL